MNELTVVYILCTDQVDYAFLVAANATLAKAVVPEFRRVCVMDRATRRFLQRSAVELEPWVDELVLADSPERNPLLSSRYLKTTLRHLIKGDYLALDIDAVLADSSAFHHLNYTALAAAPNLDHLRLAPAFPVEIGRTIYQPMGWEHPVQPYVNTGVLLCRDNELAHRFYSRWHELWLAQKQQLNIHLDQPAFNRCLWENPTYLTLLPSSFNSPVDVGADFEQGASVYHYYISIYSGRPRRDSLLGITAREIQRRGRMNKSLLRFLLKQKRAFIPQAYDRRLAVRERLWRHALALWWDGHVTTEPAQAMKPFRFRASPATNQKA